MADTNLADDVAILLPLIYKQWLVSAQPGVDAYDNIVAAVAACKAAGGGHVIIPPIGGAGLVIRDTVVVDFSNCLIVSHEPFVKLTKTDPTALRGPDAVNQSGVNGVGITAFLFAGKLTGPVGQRAYIKNSGMIASRRMTIDGNGLAASANYTYVVGSAGAHMPVVFNGVINAECRNITAYNGLNGGVASAYCPGFAITDCDFDTTQYDNGWTAYGNQEHIKPFSETDQTTWGNQKGLNLNARNCANHGIDSYGSVGMFINNWTISNCGNDRVSPTDPSGPAGGLGVEIDGAFPDRDYHFTAINGTVSGSYGFGVRTNARGTTVKSTRVLDTKMPVNYASDTPPIWGSAVFIQGGARDCDIDVEVERADNYGLRIQGSQNAAFTGSIAADGTLTVTSVSSGALVVGNDIGGPEIPPDTKIIGLGTGTGGAGTYILNTKGVTLASGPLYAGYYPGGRFRIRAKDCKKRAIYAIGYGSVSIDPTSYFERCGDPADTTSSNFVVEVNNTPVNNGGGHFSFAGEIYDNYGQPFTCSGLFNRLVLKNIRGHNNGSVYASAYHAFYITGAGRYLEMADWQLTNTNGKAARLCTVSGVVNKVVLNRPSIQGDWSSASRPAVDILNPPSSFLDNSFGKRQVLYSGNMDFNSTAEQLIPPQLRTIRYLIDEIVVVSTAANLSAARGGIYTATAKGGVALVPATQAYTALTDSQKALHIIPSDTNLRTTDLYFQLETAAGVSGFGTVYVIGIPLS